MSRARDNREVAAVFSANLLRFRKAARLSQDEVGILAGVHRTEVGLLERGKRLPRIDTVVRLAAALSISTNDLLKGIVWEPPPLTPREGQMKRTARRKKTK